MRAFFKKNSGRSLKTSVFIFSLMILASGCSFGSKTAYQVNQYTLEYSPPVLQEIAQIKELIKVERFSVAQAFDTSAIVYRDGPNLRNLDLYNRWRTKPGDMVTDFLVRDLRHSGLFQAVFYYDENDETRYLVEGQVDEFLDVSEKDGQRAVLGLNVTLLDLKRKGAVDKVVFQRNYNFVEPLPGKGPEALAQGMSRAMERFSKQLMLDLQKELTQPNR